MKALKETPLSLPSTLSHIRAANVHVKQLSEVAIALLSVLGWGNAQIFNPCCCIVVVGCFVGPSTKGDEYIAF